jgi:hypothetical protein
MSEPRRSTRRLWAAGGSLALGTAVALGACTAMIGERPVDTAPVTIDPAPSTLHRLTQAQYTNTLHDLLGASISVPSALEPDLVVDGFATVGGSVGAVSRWGIEQYETAALQVASAYLAPGAGRAALVGCTPAGNADASCARTFLGAFGRRAWRRPLESDELDRITGVATNAGTVLGDFYQGLGFGIAALFESPNFLYRVELGTADPTSGGVLRYKSYELASRLSYFLWNTTPDDALLDAAGTGALDTDDGLAAQVDRLLTSTRARDATKNFFYERLGLSQLVGLSKDTTVYPAANAQLPTSAAQETLSLVDQHLMVDNADYRELFTTRKTFVDREMASLYGVEAPSLTSFAEVLLPAKGMRAGLLGHASILSIYAHPTTTSPTLRGKFVREVLLCATIASPPANVNTALPSTQVAGPTLRDRLASHESQAFCAACHHAMDPIGLGLENFDGIGAARLADNGAPIDATGELDGTPFANAAELGEAVASHPALGPCLVRQLVRYASAAPETPGEDAEIQRLAYDFADQGSQMRKLLRAVALSPAFRTATEAL